MANAAILAEFPVMVVIFLMAGVTIGWSALENIVHMTIRTLHLRVLPFQFEFQKTVVKCGRLPACSLMAYCAIFPESAFVGIVLQMATGAIRCKGFKIGRGMCIDVALLTCQCLVFALQFKGGMAVVKIFRDGFDAVMTAPAIRAISLDMRTHKDTFNLLVTGCANNRIKFTDILCMAIHAGKDQSIFAQTM